MGLPNRKQRRKLAKDLGLFKRTSKKKKEESSEKTQALGKFIRLRNLTEQRNQNKKS